MYEMLAKHGYVDVKKMHGDTYVTTTEKGDEICNQLLRELVTFAQLSNIAPKLMEADLSHEVYKIKKGVSANFLRENANLRMVAGKLTEDILEINSQFIEEIRGIEDEP
jgi:Mn-dependent DtxR family transcriptional regulator